MTSEQALKRLTPAQRRMYDELCEPMKPGQRAWYFRQRRQRRSADILVELGYAECVESDAHAAGYRLTPLGMILSGPIAVTTPGQPK